MLVLRQMIGSCLFAASFLVIGGCEAPPVAKTAKTAPTVVSAAPVPVEAPASTPYAHPDRPLVDPPRPVASKEVPEKPVDCGQECMERSHQCSRGCAPGEEGRGCLRRCGCAKVSCDDSCDRDGTANFRCH